MRTEITNNEIKVLSGRDERYRRFSFKSDFFRAGEDYIVKETSRSLSFRRPNLDNTFVTKKAIQNGNGVCFDLFSKVPIGIYQFDEEDSNEDRVVIHFK